ncbi:MAG: peptidylprolyl isomerase [Bacteroidota bacterium]|nr:peptidylprolyl isomerase [Bacteroidota bacterium]
MKKTIFLLLCLLIFNNLNAQSDPSVMEVNGQKVSKSEFLQIYLKNNNDPKFDKASIDEYMELFTKFKLKVAEAERLGYDTIPRLKKELEGYRKQLALPYLIDSVENKALVKESYERLKKEIRASHILIKVKQNASPKDTLKAYNRLLELKKRIEDGEEFEIVAKSKNSSQDPSVMKNGGDLGFFTAFQMLYPFEEKAYNTPKGQVSDPFRTKYGYHILQVTDSRPARGTIRVAHLMVATPQGTTEEEILSAEKKINEIYEKLQESNSDEEWNEMVSKYSDDPSSSKKGGLLPIFGSGSAQRMVPVFEDAAFALKKDGEISTPVRTDYGFHILKRIEWNNIKSFDDMKKELQKKVNKDERSKKTQDVFVAKLKKKYNFRESEGQYLQWFVENLDSSYYAGRWEIDDLITDGTIFSIGEKQYRQTDFAKFIKKSYRGMRRFTFEDIVKRQYAEWVKKSVLAYEEGLLASKYPEYKALVKEYHDGIILYEVMSDMVWNKAVKDTTGLKEFYETQKMNYMWPERLDATVYICANSEISNKVYKLLKKKKNTSDVIIEKINVDTKLNLDVKMNKYDPKKVDFLKGRNLTEGRNEPFESEGKYYVVKVNETLPVMPKELSEIKGAVISDYQAFLEESWLKELKEKYPVKVNYEVLYNLGPND